MPGPGQAPGGGSVRAAAAVTGVPAAGPGGVPAPPAAPTPPGAVGAAAVFGIGGIGSDSVAAIDQGNLPVIIGFVLVAAVFVVVANLIVDFCYALLDPRVRIR